MTQFLYASIAMFLFAASAHKPLAKAPASRSERSHAQLAVAGAPNSWHCATLRLQYNPILSPQSPLELSRRLLPAVGGISKQVCYPSPHESVPPPRSLKFISWDDESDFQSPLYQEAGYASWYGGSFDGRLTASGEVFDQSEFTAAHLVLPFGTRARVVNLRNHRSVVVQINDRGPYVKDRVLDLSMAAARAIGMITSGIAPVRIEVLPPRRHHAVDRRISKDRS